MQELVWGITLALILCIVAVFVFVLINSRQTADYEAIQAHSAKLRSVFFWGLIVLGIVVTTITLQDLPYAAQSGEASVQEIAVVGHQWYWTLDKTEVLAGQPVQFNVTSADVNHGLGIYDESLTLLAQTQAMPGYTNRLRYTFEQAGTYQLLCLEFCGMAHHVMVSELTVVTAGPGGAK